jgi:hypothetical protein
VTLFKQQSASQKNWWYDRSLWNDQRTWRAKQMRNEVLAQFNSLLLRLHFLSGDQYLRERRYGHSGMP